MEIDVYQLPIPDWGIHCPRCNYPLVGLPAHRCPECGLQFDMAEVLQTWHRLRPPRFTGHEDPFPDFGLDCRRCRGMLVGAIGFECPHCGTPFDPEFYRPSRDWHSINEDLPEGVSAVVLATILASERVPYISGNSNVIRSVLGVSNITDARLLIPREFYFEALALIRETVAELKSRRTEKAQTWRCAQCGEKSPGHFEVCWNCGEGRAE